MPLTSTFVAQVKHSGKPAGDKHADGEGMYLLVKAAGKYWRMDYRHAGKRKTLALGTYPEVSLAKARDRRRDARELLADGVDPSADKRANKKAQAAAAAATFAVVAATWNAKTRAKRGPRTQKKVDDWLKNDVLPFIGSLPIASISGTDLLDRVLSKIEARGAIEAAHRVKQMCGSIFRFAVVARLAPRDVTIDLRDALTAKPKTRNHPAITDPKEVGVLLRAIHGYQGQAVTMAALRLAPLVFVRPGELRTAEWSEFDLEAAEWRIPGAKMKMGQDHIVPLSAQALAILRELQPMTGHGRYLFPSLRSADRPMSENTLNVALRSMGIPKDRHTAHGFRAMARTIMDEVLCERVDLIEHQLSHAVKDANGRAYNRTAHLPARLAMMQRWADYLDRLRQGADIIQLRPAA